MPQLPRLRVTGADGGMPCPGEGDWTEDCGGDCGEDCAGGCGVVGAGLAASGTEEPSGQPLPLLRVTGTVGVCWFWGGAGVAAFGSDAPVCPPADGWDVLAVALATLSVPPG
ncbi:hypothetical protein [Alloactinosynnema sp. L-07]|uniref:hypothetical protein n=1 Tax=Alloactinosynnema sp. L-07 TaxID=1653480 RepID=UPI00065F06CD|nr:hypothetical protein [Alloactinosynnema sp. L-07]CRK55271.1 hypothetical protein [Alloactinosynnema sp. L-07]